MSKHTPGPWAIQEIKCNRREPAYRVYSSRTLFLEVVADPDGYVVGENEANARLIAAAPDLLAALERIANETAATWVSDVARAAIAKAEGKE